MFIVRARVLELTQVNMGLPVSAVLYSIHYVTRISHSQNKKRDSMCVQPFLKCNIVYECIDMYIAISFLLSKAFIQSRSNFELSF